MTTPKITEKCDSKDVLFKTPLFCSKNEFKVLRNKALLFYLALA